MKDNYKTEVIFRKENEGTILAVFPYEIADFKGNCMSYAHAGQHSACSYDYAIVNCKPAKEIEYTDLYRELESLGYDLNVIKKRNFKKYINAYQLSR